MASLIFPFSGGISRRAWWLYQALIWVVFSIGLIVFAVSMVLNGEIPKQSSMFGHTSVIILIVMAVYLNFCTCVNRMQDTGRSAWWWLTFNLPFCGTGLMIYFCGIEKGGAVHRALNVEKDLELLRDLKEQDQVMSSPGVRYQPASPHHYADPDLRKGPVCRSPKIGANGKPGFGRRGLA